MKDKIRSVDFGFYDGVRLRTVFPFTNWTLYGEVRIPSPKNATEIRNLINQPKKK